MVLAAGRGQRMRPLSDVLPKPALPLPDGPLVSWPLRLAAAAGVERVVVNIWHLADRIQKVLEQVAPGGVEIVLSRETELMDTAGGIALARERGLLGDDGPVLVINGDCVLNLDLVPLMARHDTSGDEVTLALLPHLDPTAWSRVVLDHEDRVVRIQAPGPPAAGEVPLLYPGVMLVSRVALNRLPVQVAGIAETLWAPALKAGLLGGAALSGHWREVGTPRAFFEACMVQLDQQPRIDPTARVDSGARVGTALIGHQCRVGAGAVVAESVLAEGATACAGSRIIRSILLGPVQAGPGEVVVDEVRCQP